MVFCNYYIMTSGEIFVAGHKKMRTASLIIIRFPKKRMAKKENNPHEIIIF
jgi:hypothetical protein